MSSRPETMSETEGIELLQHQHSVIHDLFIEVAAASGSERVQAFDRLVRLLAVHETAEEELVHPLARRHMSDGERLVVDDRLEEERKAKELLRELEELGPRAPGFDTLLLQLRDAVLAHARSEERYEFNWIRHRALPGELRLLATGIKAAEAMAPTHPHPGVESATANLLTGPVVAMMDRARDLIRKATGDGEPAT
jgi:hypothetical protein